MNCKLAILTLILALSFPVFSQNPQETNAVYIANLLIDDISTDRMAQTCRFHKLSESDSEDGFTVFIDSKGNKLRFKRTDNPDEGVNGKLIEVITADKPKTVAKILKETGYTKIDNGYERGSRQTNSLIRATLSSHLLRFKRIKK
ncbi:MAG: hypothetical protein K2I44_08670 [Muribaculaceae bacterium]|nr:hypothetical protein [Muribaculaceae bacterium]